MVGKNFTKKMLVIDTTMVIGTLPIHGEPMLVVGTSKVMGPLKHQHHTYSTNKRWVSIATNIPCKLYCYSTTYNPL